MKRAFCIAATMVFAATAAQAIEVGNAGGVLLVHTTDEVFCADDGPSDSGITCNENFGDCTVEDQENCSAEMMNLSHTGPNEIASASRVIHVLAGFAEDKCPRLAGVTFGIEYDEDNVYLDGYGSRSDFELPDSQWPRSFTGTAITWNQAEKAQLTEVYWFAAYAYYGAGTITLTAHPSQGGYFADDSVPPTLEEIMGFGVFGLGGGTGSNPVPFTPVLNTTWGGVKQAFSEQE